MHTGLTGLISDGLAPWGQAAAIIIALYTFISVIVGLVLAAVFMFLLAWLREKSELIKQLRPHLDQVNQAVLAEKRGDPLPREVADNKVVQVVARVPRTVEALPDKASAIDRKVEQGSNRIAGTVIELRARTEMVKGMAKAFFLPGLAKRRVSPPAPATLIELPEREQVAAAETRREEPPMEQEIVITQSWR